jgi:hypothetical protein
MAMHSRARVGALSSPKSRSISSDKSPATAPPPRTRQSLPFAHEAVRPTDPTVLFVGTPFQLLTLDDYGVAVEDVVRELLDLHFPEPGLLQHLLGLFRIFS